MKTKSKIFIFICTFALIFSLVSVSCFAYVSSIEVGKTYTFNSRIVLDNMYDDEIQFDVSGDLLLSIDGTEFDSFVVEGYHINISNGYYFYDYYYDISVDQWVWERENFDTGDVVRFSSLSFDVVYLAPNIDYRFLDWLSGNVILDERANFYDQIFSSVSNAVFGGQPLSPEQNLSLSLISTVLSIGMVLLPVLLAIGFLLRCFRL